MAKAEKEHRNVVNDHWVVFYFKAYFGA